MEKKKEISNTDFCTVEEAAELLSCSIFTIRKLCRENKLKSVKKLKRYYIFKNDITEFLKSK